MKKTLEKSGKSQGILSEEKSGNPEYSSVIFILRLKHKLTINFIRVENRHPNQRHQRKENLNHLRSEGIHPGELRQQPNNFMLI